MTSLLMKMQAIEEAFIEKRPYFLPSDTCHWQKLSVFLSFLTSLESFLFFHCCCK
jgi:hypothetical protein